MDNTTNADKNPGKRISTSVKDLLVILAFIIFVFILSYHFGVFKFLTNWFIKYPKMITWVDEIITGLLTLSTGLAIFAWRRWHELKKETAERIKLQEQLILLAETKAETAEIICKELRSEIDYHRKAKK